jgi:hypothetical protein
MQSKACGAHRLTSCGCAGLPGGGDSGEHVPRDRHGRAVGAHPAGGLWGGGPPLLLGRHHHGGHCVARAARAAHTAQADAHALQGLRHHLLIWRCQSCCLFRTLQISLIWRYRPGCLLWTRQISCVLALPAHGHPDCLIRTWRISRSCCLGMADEGAPEYMIRT